MTRVQDETATLLTTASHYKNHSVNSYESAWFYSSGAYIDFLASKVRESLGICSATSANCKLLDIGGGTGNFTRNLLEGSDLSAVVVDPYLSHAQDTMRIKFIREKAEKFETPERFQFCLMKEVVHHLENRLAAFSSIKSLLDPSCDSSFLIITRPKYVDCPLWKEAIDLRAQNFPETDEIEADLFAAGFKTVRVEMKVYPCDMLLNDWLKMVMNRCWSTFSYFTEEELMEGCEQIYHKAETDYRGHIQFEERLLFITANPT
mmetsp:Transcript_1478/g.2025  ORF Transcript_1478/g.2025 Transcript_1478/m.2025 type:complete len:262 (-) Transcript_1478:90-875(-)